ncbi:putative lipase atg15 [Physocladia obscura]|uniref:triacylglycerol lipase n=1 Tax=Physocladia obscura TaxID=109957 RepID=A0AAD5SW23_9FUNG|nr:putative lipase atg15 [Physocladia obscura]
MYSRQVESHINLRLDRIIRVGHNSDFTIFVEQTDIDKYKSNYTDVVSTGSYSNRVQWIPDSDLPFMHTIVSDDVFRKQFLVSGVPGSVPGAVPNQQMTHVLGHRDEILPDQTDRETILNLGLMAFNSYYEPDNAEWIQVPGWLPGNGFGSTKSAIRGHIYKSTDPSLDVVIIVIKGTSLTTPFIGGKTGPNDKLNDNKMFSCCCGKAAIADAAMDLYPLSSVWTTGHSLGGALAALVALTFDFAAVTFEAPGDLLFAKRIGLLPPAPPMFGYFDLVQRQQHQKSQSAERWQKQLGGDVFSMPSFATILEDGGNGEDWDEFLETLPIYQFGNDGDPIYLGTCLNGVSSSCWIGGYAMETKCHIGKECVYDQDKDGEQGSEYFQKKMMGLKSESEQLSAIPIRTLKKESINNHGIQFIIDNYLKKWKYAPECRCKFFELKKLTVTVWLESEYKKDEDTGEGESEESEEDERINKINNDNGNNNNNILRTPLRFVLPVNASSCVSQLNRVLCDPLLDLCSMLRRRSLAIRPLLDHLILHIEDLLANASYRSPLDAELLPSFSLKQCGYLTLQPPLLKVVLFGVPTKVYACLFPPTINSQSRKRHFARLNSPAVSDPSNSKSKDLHRLTVSEYFSPCLQPEEQFPVRKRQKVIHDGEGVLQDPQNSVAKSGAQKSEESVTESNQHGFISDHEESRNSAQSTYYNSVSAIKNFAPSPIFVNPEFSSIESSIVFDKHSVIQPAYSAAHSSISAKVQTFSNSKSHTQLNETEFGDKKKIFVDSLDILPPSPSIMKCQTKILVEATSTKQLLANPLEVQSSKKTNQKLLPLPQLPLPITEVHEFPNRSSFNEFVAFTTPRSLTVPAKPTTTFASVFSKKTASIAPPESPAVMLLGLQILPNKPHSQMQHRSPKLPASLLSIGRSHLQPPPTMAMIIDDSDGSDVDNSDDERSEERNYDSEKENEEDGKRDAEDEEHDEDDNHNADNNNDDGKFEKYTERLALEASADRKLDSVLPPKVSATAEATESEKMYIHESNNDSNDNDESEYEYVEMEVQVEVEIDSDGNEIPELKSENDSGELSDENDGNDAAASILREGGQNSVSVRNNNEKECENRPNENNSGQDVDEIENEHNEHSTEEAKIDLEIVEMMKLMEQNEGNFGDESDQESSNCDVDNDGGHDDVDDEIVLKTPSGSENESTTVTKIPQPPLIVSDEGDENHLPPLFSLIPDTQASQVSSVRRGRASNFPDSQINITPETFLDFSAPLQPAVASPPASSLRSSYENPQLSPILPHLRYQPKRRQISGDGFGRLHTTLKDISEKFSFFGRSGGTRVNQGGIVTPTTTITSTKNSDDSDMNDNEDADDKDSDNSDSDSSSSDSSSRSHSKIKSKEQSNKPQFAGAEKKQKQKDQRKSLLGLLAKDSEFEISTV